MDTLILCLLGALFVVPMVTLIVGVIRGRKRQREVEGQIRRAHQSRPTAEEIQRANDVARRSLRAALKGMQ